MARKVKVMVGLVSIPTLMEKAVEDEKSNKDTHTVCTGTEEKPHAPARVRNKVTCESCGRVETSVFGYKERGIEQDGKLTVIPDAQLKAAAGAPIKELDLRFHPREKVAGATVTGGSVNYMVPDKGGEKTYGLLLDALTARPDLVAVGVQAPVSKNTMWVIEVVDNRLIASSLAWPEDVRPAPAIPRVEALPQESELMSTVVDTMTEDFDVLTYVDEARRGKAELIASLAGEAVEVPTVVASPAAGGDLLAQLQATVKAIKPKAPAKKTAAKRPAKKAVAKKAPAKRAAKKTTAA